MNSRFTSGVEMKPITNVTVNLLGEDGNAFFILGKVKKAMRRAGIAQEVIDEFNKEATSGDYDKLLQTVMKYVEVK